VLYTGEEANVVRPLSGTRGMEKANYHRGFSVLQSRLKCCKRENLKYQEPFWVIVRLRDKSYGEPDIPRIRFHSAFQPGHDLHGKGRTKQKLEMKDIDYFGNVLSRRARVGQIGASVSQRAGSDRTLRKARLT